MLNNPKPGYNALNEYQASALPWVTSSYAAQGRTYGYNFDYVTKFVVIKNLTSTSGSNLRVGFTKNGVENSNYFLVAPSDQIDLEYRVNELYLRADGAYSVQYSVAAGLTAIESRFAVPITGSNGYNGVG